MKVVLFCGGLGTRLRAYSDTIPKPMLDLGNRPILWHLMKYYSHFGYNDFILCLGYRSEYIKNFFLKYNECDSNDFTMSNGGASITVHKRDIQDWRITFADTGMHTNIGQRLVQVRKYLEGESIFLANYSDGLSDVELAARVDEFRKSNAVASFASVRTSQSFHNVEVNDEGYVDGIRSAIDADMWINGGFFILRREIFDYIEDGEDLVVEPFARLISEKRLKSYKHDGFWACMDTFKDKVRLEKMYSQGDRPWELHASGEPLVPSIVPLPIQSKPPDKAAMFKSSDRTPHRKPRAKVGRFIAADAE
jgi:glucose-1-phosphate cytidylyltransferase